MSLLSKAIQHIITRDRQASIQASPTEQHMINSNVYTDYGPGMMAEPNLPYSIQQTLQPDAVSDIPFGGFSSGVGIGITSANVGQGTSVPDSYFDSNGLKLFNDARVHPAPSGGYDSQAGVANNRRVIMPMNDDMWLPELIEDHEFVEPEFDIPYPDGQELRPGGDR